MTTAQFDQLFGGYPNNWSTNKLRHTVQIAILTSLVELKRIQVGLPTIRSATGLRKVIADINRLPITNLSGMPRAKDTLRDLLRQSRRALRIYNVATGERKKLTQAELGEMKQGVIATVEALLEWLESVQPSGIKTVKDAIDNPPKELT